MNKATREYLAGLAAQSARKLALQDDAAEVLRVLDSLAHAVARQDEAHMADALVWARSVLDKHADALADTERKAA